MQEDKIVYLKDGRAAAYTEHGDLTGRPLLFFHGNPGSRYTRHPDESIVQRMGYDHETDSEAEAMEQLEHDVLARLEIPDPYRAQKLHELGDA